MREWLIIILFAALLIGSCSVAASACYTSSTEHGDCVGLMDEKNPAKIYKVDAGNIIIAIVFSELIIVPIYVALDAVQCPVADHPVSNAK